MSTEDLTSEDAQQIALDQEPPKKYRQSFMADNGPLMILSLFLLLLAFFILLVTTSKIDDSKRAAVFNSMAATFVLNRQKLEDYDVRINEVGDYTEDDLLELHKHLWVALIPLVNVDIPKTGNTMELTVHSNDLFEPGTSALKQSTQTFLERMVRSLNNPNEHFRAKVLFQLQNISNVDSSIALKQFFDGDEVIVEFNDTNQLEDIYDPRNYFADLQNRQSKSFIVPTNTDTLQFARALSMAHHLEKTGAKAEKLLVGIQENVSETIRITYERYVSDEYNTPKASNK